MNSVCVCLMSGCSSCIIIVNHYRYQHLKKDSMLFTLLIFNYFIHTYTHICLYTSFVYKKVYILVCTNMYSSPNTNNLYIHYMDKSTGTPSVET